MPGEDTFTLRAPFAVYRLRVLRIGQRTADVGQAVLRRQARRELCVGIEWGDPETMRVALALQRALAAGAVHDLGDSRGVSSQSLSEQRKTALVRRLAEAFDLGHISVDRETHESLREREAVIGELPPLPPPPRESPLTFFEVRFVDEIGQAITGVPVEYQVDGGLRGVTTNAAGIALLEGVKDPTAKAGITEVQTLGKALESRWRKRRLGAPPKEANVTKLAFEGEPIGPLGVRAVIPQTVVLEPPRGRLFVELLDKTGRRRHARRDYTISGPESLAGTTDDDGVLRHDGVFPGDYTLTFRTEFFEGKDKRTEAYESPLVVLSRDAVERDQRLIGAIPQCVLARLHFFFNTNKAFLLPTALPSVRVLRRLYLENNPAKLLVVGHADTAGGSAYNDQLSLERAEATLAYLKDDVDGWLELYGDGVEEKKRWGKVEDQLMIRSMPDFRLKPRGEDAVRWYQRTRALEVDGKAGPQTRRKLIYEYMSLDGASLSELDLDVEATAHGCGEHFPLDETGEDVDAAPKDGKRDPRSRRVELFFFDAEFGIVPSPSGKNSTAASGEYPAWRNGATETIDLEAGDLEGPQVTFVELIDNLFRSNSAVVLPEGEAPSGDSTAHESLTSVGAFATVLRFIERNADRKLLIAGHTDSVDDVDFNQKLSEERAACALAVLTGDRAAWKVLCDARHRIADYKQILSWVSRAFVETGLDFDCDPGRIDDNEATGTEPVRRFQSAYNENKLALGATAPDLEPDGRVGPLTWGAFFDCYELALQQELAEDAGGLAELREKLAFVDDAHQSLGFSEHFPIEELGVDDFKSQTNRRVEVLMFAPGEEPDVEHAAGDPETSEIYLPGHYRREPLDRPGTGAFVAPAIGVRLPTRFSVDKSFPKPSAVPGLRAVLELLQKRPELRLVIVGHADPTGTDADNHATSLARAEAIRAWLVGDTDFFADQFSKDDPRRGWDWEEIQWMLYGVRAGESPCYIGQADGFPGDRTEEALGSFQLSTEDLTASYAADEATVARLITEYVGLVGDDFVDPSRVEVVGGGSWHPPQTFAGGPALPEEAELRDLRRVELFLFAEAPRPPVEKFPRARALPTVYRKWCAQVGEELVPEAATFHLEAVDADGTPLTNVNLEIAQIVDDVTRTPLGALTTNSRGIATATLPPGLYVAQVQRGAGEALVASAVIEPDATCGVALSFGSGGGLDPLTSA